MAFHYGICFPKWNSRNETVAKAFVTAKFWRADRA